MIHGIIDIVAWTCGWKLQTWNLFQSRSFFTPPPIVYYHPYDPSCSSKNGLFFSSNAKFPMSIQSTKSITTMSGAHDDHHHHQNRSKCPKLGIFVPSSSSRRLYTPTPSSSNYYPTLVVRNNRSKSRTTRGSYELIQTVPHDESAFTQGLSMIHIMDGISGVESSYLFESTGLYGSSELRYVDEGTGCVHQRYQLQEEFFGEGIAQYNYYPNGFNKELTYQQQRHNVRQKRLVQLTWKEQIAFVYNVFANNNTVVLSPSISNFSYTTTNSNEGWGITYRPDTHVFYVTDGSDNLHTWDADTFLEIHVQKITRTKQHTTTRRPPQPYQHRGCTQSSSSSSSIWYNHMHHTSTDVPLSSLNELEWDATTKTLLANVWHENYIVRIEPDSGHVVTVYDLGSLYTNRTQSSDVMNGIAIIVASSCAASSSYTTTSCPTEDVENSSRSGSSLVSSRRSSEVWITGKLWPSMYRIKLID